MTIDKKIMKVVHEELDKFSKYFPSHDFEVLKTLVSVKKRNLGKNKAGIAYLQKCLIELNSQLIEKYSFEEVKITLLHELGHLITFFMFGANEGKAHGKQWKRVMQLMEQTPDRCHSLKFEPLRATKQFMYKCDCNTPHPLSSVRHKRSMAGTKYVCTNCKSGLVFVG